MAGCARQELKRVECDSGGAIGRGVGAEDLDLACVLGARAGVGNRRAKEVAQDALGGLRFFGCDTGCAVCAEKPEWCQLCILHGELKQRSMCRPFWSGVWELYVIRMARWALGHDRDVLVVSASSYARRALEDVSGIWPPGTGTWEQIWRPGHSGLR